MATQSGVTSGGGDTTIVRAAIYPAIGVARVGNSPDQFFLAPEVPDPLPEPPGFYRDMSGALKRQAVRFRVYGLNAAGLPVAELTADNADIRWSVHLANEKASWYQFQLALDIPEASSAPPSQRRNATVSDRRRLTIDPGSRSITGRGEGGAAYRFDSGTFMDRPVYLGELRTDGDGRLIVLGGHGKSASFNGAPAVTFANNDGWHDDTADGPVTATVSLGNQSLPVDPAWIVVAPPNYGPMRKSVRTMWDLMRDVAINSLMLQAPPKPSFQQDIRPIFERLSGLQWVNAGFAAGFGWGAPSDFTTPECLEKLSRTDDSVAEFRRTIANQFRPATDGTWSPVPWPWLYGDAMNIPTPDTWRAFAVLTGTQIGFLQQWASGDFEADYDPGYTPPRSLNAVPVAEQPALLDRASLEFCLADAFHPGCEMTWPMRTPGMFMSAFRLAHAPPGWVEPDYGPVIGPDIVNRADGPLQGGQLPGGITRWMAVPWQTDTASCRSGYEPTYDPYLPTFWPARVPNQVLAKSDYDIVMDEERPLAERLMAFAHRTDWDAPLGENESYIHQINLMIGHFDTMGIVEVRDGPRAGPFPLVMGVQDRPETAPLRTAGAVRRRIDLSRIEKVRRFPAGLRR